MSLKYPSPDRVRTDLLSRVGTSFRDMLCNCFVCALHPVSSDTDSIVYNSDRNVQMSRFMEDDVKILVYSGPYITITNIYQKATRVITCWYR